MIFKKVKCPGGCPEGMLKLRFDRYISNKLRIKQRITEDAHLPYTLTNFSPQFRQKKLKIRGSKSVRVQVKSLSYSITMVSMNKQ